MRRMFAVKTPALGALAGLLAVMLTAAPSSAIEYSLVAKQFSKTVNGRVVPMWGYALDTGQSCVPSSSPEWAVGPRLTVPSLDNVLTVHLRNCLNHPVSIMIPGQYAALAPVEFVDGMGRSRATSFTQQVATGATADYTWSDFQPGTYLYHSGTHPALQVQMGLYGAAVKDAAAGEAYPGLAYDTEVVLLYSEIDPAVHDTAVSGGKLGASITTSTFTYKPAYFLVNGESFQTASLTKDGQVIAAGDDAGTVLLRFLNAGLASHAPTLLGDYMKVVAEDGTPYPYAKDQYGFLLPAGGTRDAIWSPAAAGVYTVYDRRLFTVAAGASDGGMISKLSVAASVPPAPPIPSLGSGRPRGRDIIERDRKRPQKR